MIRVTTFGHDWQEKEAESVREVVLTTPVSTVRVVEKNGVLQVQAVGAVSR